MKTVLLYWALQKNLVITAIEAGCHHYQLFEPDESEEDRKYVLKCVLSMTLHNSFFKANGFVAGLSQVFVPKHIA